MEKDKENKKDNKGTQNQSELDKYYNFQDDYQFYYYQPWRIMYPLNLALLRRYHYFDKKKEI
ncbi:hypothetical protein [Bacillus sp. 166amftsu]|uniref:hypothetical protein n=1 Tax=Bacillus sp. 166amftsu TaxID=1761753 RepID=UPI00089CD78E|nr:hypothetical protein [Bacillus sp. 166amftsu]SDZ40502.1 hypothetical protein SAMN04488156_12816 [Bacillus sp. 166amftsu]